MFRTRPGPDDELDEVETCRSCKFNS